jgi:site-specific DNA recombinase
MRVVALFRVSTDKQGSDGTSLDGQERLFRDMAAKDGWDTVAEFRGVESATQAATERRVLQQVLACLRQNAVDAVWVVEQSRLTRGDELEVAMLFRELKERKIKININGLVRDPGSIDELFMLRIQSAVDSAESQRIKERMRRGKTQRAMQGKKNSGPAPYGYRNPLPHEPGRGTLQIVEEQAVAVRRIYDLAAKGNGTRAIASDLNARGVPAPKGSKWGKTTVTNILQNPAYIGTAASNVWVGKKGTRGFRFNPGNDNAIVVENAHKPIVDREVWNAVRGRPRLPRTPTPRMLSGLLYVDGRRYEGDCSRTQRLYRAPKGVGGCPWLDAPTTDGAVWDAFASLATSEQFVEQLMAEANKPQERMVVLQEMDHIDEQIGKHRRRLDGYVEMRADGDLSKAEFQAKADATNRAIRDMEAELGRLRAQAAALDGTQASRVVRAVQTVLAGKTKLTCDQKRAILRSIVRRIDATAERTGERFKRDDRGRVLAGRTNQWRVGRISFTLALQPRDDADVPREPGFGAGAPRANVTQAAGFRPGQLATTP